MLRKLRHPSILRIVDTVEENKAMLAFAAEPVFASLGNVLKNLNNFDGACGCRFVVFLAACAFIFLIFFWGVARCLGGGLTLHLFRPRQSLPAGNVPSILESYELEPLEIQSGLVQVSEALYFCHQEKVCVVPLSLSRWPSKPARARTHIFSSSLAFFNPPFLTYGPQLTHCNVCPENIFLTPSGEWRVGLVVGCQHCSTSLS